MNLPPIAVMLAASFIYSDSGQPAGLRPHFGTNDNFSILGEPV